MRAVLLTAAIVAATLALSAQSGTDRTLLGKPLAESWPTYNGDYSGRRYSALAQINQSNVKSLTLAWTRRLTNGTSAPGVQVIEGGIGDITWNGATQVKGSILEVDGVLYVTTPDNTWAIDGRTGREIWHYVWKTRGGTHIGNRGVGMWNNYLFFVTPDNYLISLDARTGKARWTKALASFEQQYFHTMAPVVIDNHVLVGSSNDLDMSGFLQSFDPESGSCSGSGMPPRSEPAMRDSTRGRTSTRRSMVADTPGCPGPTIPRLASTSWAQAIPRRRTRPRRAGKAWPISSPAPSWRCTSTPGRWRGSIKRRRTIRTTGIRRRRRSSLTVCSAAASGSWR
jgi:PQQ-like domain